MSIFTLLLATLGCLLFTYLLINSVKRNAKAQNTTIIGLLVMALGITLHVPWYFSSSWIELIIGGITVPFLTGAIFCLCIALVPSPDIFLPPKKLK